ncbi:Cadherin-23 [Halotydeus destructor]|nr:Cadherin-23 [Halotydeus destructor]
MDFDDEGISLCLDHEAQPSYSLSYEARDGGGKHSTVNLFIEILDVNDNIPIFSNQIHVREVYDKETTISPPLILRATDADGPSQGGNGAIRYMLKDTNLTGILVDAITGEVKLTKPVSMEYEQNRATGIRRKLHYEAIVRAIDGGDPPLESEAKLVFHVKSERDGAPSFIAEPYNVSIPENSKPGSAVLQVKATDPDGPDSALRYAIVDGAKDNFVINSETGNILIGSDSNLDRDVFGDSYELVVSVVDSGFPVPLTSTCVVYIRIEDVNNKPPKFSTDSHVVYLTDAELIPNREIIKLIATDPDRSAKIRYSFDEEGIVVRDNTGFVLVNGNSMATSAFKIDHTTGSVKVGQKLDSSKASVISIPVMAVDVNAFNGVESPQFALTELTIYIRNEDAKNPIFAAPWTHSSPSYEISLSEETATGSTVLTMSAKDALTNRPIHEFEKIKETDPDNHFSVNPLTGIVTINKRLDFEELPIKQAKFSVRAIGTGPAGSTSRPSSIANVIVTVIDINDNSPVFTQDMYSASVLESAEWPQTIITVSATDADSGAYGTLNYAVSGDGSHLFEINRKTGLVGIKKNVTLDRETKSVYNLQVTATDNNGVHFDDDEVHLNPSVVQRRTSVLVSIRLQDSNDNAPIFERERYEAVVPENVPIGFVVSHIHATDVDEGLNGQITYEVVGFDDIPEKRRLFEINETTGILTVAASLSGKGRPDPYEVTIKANDGGKIPLSSEVTVSIVVGDISANDGIPLFVKPAENEVVYVSENANPGTFVYQVEAVDADNPSTQNGKVMYKFLEHEPHFEIDPLSGIITTATNKKQRTENYRLDREKKANYTIILVAFDLGLPPQESHRVLSIRLNDTDDNEPRFERSISALPVMFEVSENAPLGSEIAKVKAIDDDVGINAQVVYEIINGNEKEMFAMSTDSSGFGVVKSKKNLDKEVDDKFLLTIRALNVRKTNPKAVKYLPYEKNDFAQIQVEIHVKDVDDNKPQFSLSNYVIGSKYDVELFTPLITFKAVDPDKSDVKPRISYSISDAQFVSGKVTKSNVSHVFSLENASGILRNEVSLKSYLNGYFNLTILGQSSQSEGPFSMTFVNCKVFILREKDFLKFVFKRRPNEISKDLKKLEYDFGHAMASSPLKLSLNFDSTQYYQRKDGSLDFESSAACFQLIKSSDGGSDLVLDRSEGVKFLKADGSLPYNKSLKELYDTYDIVSVEECVVTKNNYSMSPSEMGLLVLASAIAVLGIFFAFLASGMKRTLKKRMAALGIVSGYNGPMFVGTNHPPINGSYGVPMSKASSFISVSEMLSSVILLTLTFTSALGALCTTNLQPANCTTYQWRNNVNCRITAARGYSLAAVPTTTDNYLQYTAKSAAMKTFRTIVYQLSASNGFDSLPQTSQIQLLARAETQINNAGSALYGTQWQTSESRCGAGSASPTSLCGDVTPATNAPDCPAPGP